MTQYIIATRGLPASGKSTWAVDMVAKSGGTLMRVNRDLLRQMMFQKAWGDGGEEKIISAASASAIRAALDGGKSVVVDNTHLRASTIGDLYKIAQEYDGRVQLRIQDFPVDIKEAIRRDAARDASVGEAVIRKMSAQFMKNGSDLPDLDPKYYEKIVPMNEFVYTEDNATEKAWLVDVDGTLAHIIKDGRSPYDYSRVSEDDPDERVIALVKELKAAGYKIVVMSGREDSCKADTIEWLGAYGVPFDEIHMRKTGDGRKDSIVKSELFEEHIRGRYVVAGVLDDRDQVVRMWRSKGLLCAQVAYGNF